MLESKKNISVAYIQDFGFRGKGEKRRKDGWKKTGRWEKRMERGTEILKGKKRKPRKEA